MTFTDSDATRILAAIDQRLDRKYKNGAQTLTTWGEVAGVDSDGKAASVYLYGETESAYVSENFRFPNVGYATIGDTVKVAMDYATGDRWVVETSPGSTYRKFLLDSARGVLSWGDGTAATDTDLSRVGAGMLATTRLRLTATDDVSLSSTAHPLQIGPDGAENVAFDQNEIHARNNGAASALNLNADGGKVQINLSSNPTTSADGLLFGSDVNLYRAAANSLKTDDDLTIAGGNLYLGSDVKVYRSAANMLKTDDDFTIGNGYLYLGADANLYRSGTNQLKTDDTFVVGSGTLYLGALDFYVSGNGVGLVNSGAAKPLKAGGILVSNSFADPDPNIKGIQFGADANLYWNAANVLKTDDSLQVAADLSANTLSMGGGGAIKSIYGGSVTVSPTADTISSATITGLSLAGTSFYAALQVRSSVPGDYLNTSYATTGIGASINGSGSIPSSSGMTVYYVRGNTTNTGIDVIIIGY